MSAYSEYRNKSYIFGNKILVRLHYLLYNIFNSQNSIRPPLRSSSMRTGYIYLIDITESSFSWQLVISPSPPLRQVVYPSSNVKNTLVPATTWQTQKFIIIIGIQPLGWSGQRPELSQATGMALVCCILGKFLGVACHCFPPAFSLFPLFTTWCLHVRHDVRDPSGGSGNCGRECCPVILPKWRLPRHLGNFYMPQIYDMGPTALLPLRRKACWGVFHP